MSTYLVDLLEPSNLYKEVPYNHSHQKVCHHKEFHVTTLSTNLEEDCQGGFPSALALVFFRLNHFITKQAPVKVVIGSSTLVDAN